MGLKKYITIKELIYITILILGLIFLYVDSATSQYPYNSMYLFSGYALIIVSIVLSIKFGK